MNANNNNKFHIILNPVAGSGKAQRLCPQLQEIAKTRGGTIRVTEFAGQACSLAKSSSKYTPLIFAAGGDDTIREVLEGMFSAPVTLGIIPVGTFNNFAASLWLPPDPIKAFLGALDGADHAIDTGKIENGPLFIESVGVGLDANAWSRATLPEPKGWHRWIRGFRLGLESLINFQPENYRLTVDGRTFPCHEVLQIIVANSRCFGSGIQIAPNARLDDGLLDVCIITRINKLKFLALLPLFYFGKHINNMSQVHYFQCRKITIDSRKKTPVRVDGMIADKLPIRIQSLPGSLKIRLPKYCLEQKLSR